MQLQASSASAAGVPIPAAPVSEREVYTTMMKLVKSEPVKKSMLASVRGDL